MVESRWCRRPEGPGCGCLVERPLGAWRLGRSLLEGHWGRVLVFFEAFKAVCGLEVVVRASGARLWSSWRCLCSLSRYYYLFSPAKGNTLGKTVVN